MSFFAKLLVIAKDYALLVSVLIAIFMRIFGTVAFSSRMLFSLFYAHYNGRQHYYTVIFV